MLKKLTAAMDTVKRSQLINTMFIGYAFAVILYQLLYLLVPFRALLFYAHLEFLSPVLAVLGLFLFLGDLITNRCFLKTKLSWLLVSLIGVMGISSVFALEHGITDNAKAIIWQITQLLVLFPLYNRMKQDWWEQALAKGFGVLSAIFIPVNLISLFQFFFNIGYIHTYGVASYRQGFLEGRLFGLYYSPHFAGIFLLLMTIFSLFFAVKGREGRSKGWYIAFAVIHFLCCVLSGTRSVIVGAAITASIVILLWFCKKKYQGLRKIWRKTLIALLPVGCAVAVVLLFTVTDVLGRSALTVFTEIRYSILHVAPPDDSVADDPSVLDPSDPSLPLDRPDISNGDLSNNRFRIWNDHLAVILDNPISFLVGNSPGSYMKHIKENFPDLFIVEYIREHYPNMYDQNLVYDVHNAYLGAWASAGLLGLLLVVLFLLIGFVKTVRTIMKSSQSDPLLFLFLTVVLFIAVTSFFDSDLFFKCTSTSVLFWFFCGLLLKTTETGDSV